MLFDWIVAMWPGFVLTLKLTAAIAVIKISMALVLAAGSFSDNRLVSRGSRLYGDLARSIPILPTLFFVYYGLGDTAVRMGIPTFWLICLVFVVLEGGYTVELYRGVFESISAGQWEAAHSLGLSWPVIVIRIVIPSVARPLIPVTVNILVITLKDTSLASIVAMPEVTLAAFNVVSETFTPMPVYLLLGAFYLSVAVPLIVVSSYLERRFAGYMPAARGGRRLWQLRTVATRLTAGAR